MSLSGMVKIPRRFDRAQGVLGREVKVRHAGGIVIWIPFFNGMTDAVRHLDPAFAGTYRNER